MPREVWLTCRRRTDERRGAYAFVELTDETQTLSGKGTVEPPPTPHHEPDVWLLPAIQWTAVEHWLDTTDGTVRPLLYLPQTQYGLRTVPSWLADLALDVGERLAAANALLNAYHGRPKTDQEHGILAELQTAADQVLESTCPLGEIGAPVARIASGSDPGLRYRVVQTPEGWLACECLGFHFRGRCRHVEHARAQQEGISVS